MKEIVRTTCEIFWLALVLAASIAGVYWVLRTYLGLSRGGAILLVSPTALLLGLTSIYAYYLGWERRRVGRRVTPPRVVFRYVSQLFLFSLFVLVQGLAIIYFASRNDLRMALLFSVSGALTSLWGARNMQKAANLMKIEQVHTDTAQPSSWPAFERAFRIFVFILVLALPVVFSLLFLLVFKDIPVTVLLALIAGCVAPWIIPKLKREIRHRDR